MPALPSAAKRHRVLRVADEIESMVFLVIVFGCRAGYALCGQPARPV
jgi:hypothetical protein